VLDRGLKHLPPELVAAMLIHAPELAEAQTQLAGGALTEASGVCGSQSAWAGRRER
jgi:hypothetical protein